MLKLKKLFPITFLMVSFIILIALYIYYSIPRKLEHMTSENCNLNLKNRAPFCTWDVPQNKCICAFQKDNLNRYFDVPSSCCPLDCNVLTKEQCIARGNNENNVKQAYFYCPNKGICERLVAYQDANKISNNYCGIDPLTNQLIDPFLTAEECNNGISLCAKYDNYSVGEKKAKCLADTNCGWCTNSQGIGDCVDGTATAPLNIYKYNFCTVDAPSDDNKYTYTGAETVEMAASTDYDIDTMETQELLD